MIKLAKCGCGGELYVTEGTTTRLPPVELIGRPRTRPDEKVNWYAVSCRKCKWSTMEYFSKEQAIEAANRAMGWEVEK